MTFFFIELTAIICLCITQSFLDIKKRQVNLILIFIFSAGIFLLRTINYSIQKSWIYLLYGLIVFFFYLIIYFASRKNLGFGDVVFGFFTGLCIYKWQYLWISILITVICLSVFLLIMKLKKINLQNFRIPFIPFLSAGLILAFVLSYSL